jgi:lysophospholipase L1-like esterase
MRKALPWVVAAIAVIAFGVAYHELTRVRARLGQLTRHTFHDHMEVRQFIIRFALANTTHPIVVVGDSITEIAHLPESLCGYPVVNAGVGGATAADFSYVAPVLLEAKRPVLLVVALGANDASNAQFASDYAALFAKVKSFGRVIAVAATAAPSINDKVEAAAHAASIPFFEIEIPSTELIEDGIHFDEAAYRRWVPALSRAITSELRCESAQAEPRTQNTGVRSALNPAAMVSQP